jgi:hypothetical protein
MPLTDKQLETELRAIRPELDPDFAAQLDAWAAEGFPARTRQDHRSERKDRRRFGNWFPRLAVAASVLAAAVIAVSAVRGLDGSNDDAAPMSREAIESEDAGAGAAIEPAPMTVPPSPGDARGEQLRPAQERIQERSAQMTLSAEPDEVADVADGVVEVTERYDWIVVSSTVNTSSERGRATFDLRIPTQNLQAALAEMSDLASVRERNEGTLDITSPFITAEERFADAKAAVDSLVAQLSDADTTDEVSEIREELRVARGELAAARTQLAGLKRRADFSRVSLTVVGDGDADGWSLGDAADDAVGVLEDLSGAALIALAVILPLAIVAMLAGLGYRLYVRRARDRALGG